MTPSLSRSSLALFASALFLSACASAPTPRQIAQEAVVAMGGMEKLQSIKTITMTDGTGTRLRLGQTQKATDPETPAKLTAVTETADLAGGRAALDYQIQVGEFMQHRNEI